MKRILGAALLLMNLWQPIEAMDIHVRDGDLRSVVQGMVQSQGLNIIGSEQLKGPVDITLKNVELEDALTVLGKAHGFKALIDENMVQIVSAKAEKTKSISMVCPSYIRPETMAKAFQVVLAKGKAVPIAETNTVVVSGTAYELAQVEEIARAIDKKAQQVQVDIYVIAAEEGLLKEHGIQWQWDFGTKESTGDDKGKFKDISLSHSTKEDPYSFLIRPHLYGMEGNGQSMIIAKPNMVAMNGEKATILIGDKIPVLIETHENGKSKETIQYEEAGIKLAYEPHITADGHIDALIHAEVSTPHMVPELKAYRITTRQASTRVCLHDGEILAIGGLMDRRGQKKTEKVPILGDIPILGKLFQYSLDKKENVELILLLQAHILHPEERLEAK